MDPGYKTSSQLQKSLHFRSVKAQSFDLAPGNTTRDLKFKPLPCQGPGVGQALIVTAWQAVPPSLGSVSHLHRFAKLYKSDANIFSC